MKTLAGFIIRLAIAIIIVLGVRSVRAATEITGYITITNTPAGLTTNIVVNIGAADTRNWTNSVAGAPGTSIAITNSTAASATNLYQHLASYPVYSAGAGSPQLAVSLNSTNTSVVNMVAPLNTNLTVTFGGNWARVVYVTNTYTDSAAILNRTNAMSSPARTNAENAIVNLLAANLATNAVPTNVTFLRNYADTNTPQTVANKTLVNPVSTGGRWTGITNLVGTNVLLTNVTLRLATITAADLTGLITLLSNGTIYATVLDGVRPTNVTGLAGAVHQIIGGHWTNATLVSPVAHTAIISNGTLIGSTVVTGASINLIGSGANNFISLTATSTTAAVGSILVLERENGITNAVDSGDVLGLIGFTGYGTTAQKVGARIRAIPMETFTDSTAGTILLLETSASGSTSPLGRLHISESGFVTISNVLYAATTTNSTFRGTNTLNGRLDLVPRSNSSLANGYNSDVLLGTNVYIRMSGPSAAYTNVGFRAAAAVDGTLHILQADNPGLSFTVLDDSGLDATAANRIRTGTGALKNSTNNPVVFSLLYDGSVSRWRLFDWPPN